MLVTNHVLTGALVGLACLASSRSGDIRDLTTGKKKEKQASGVMGRLLAAMKGGI